MIKSILSTLLCSFFLFEMNHTSASVGIEGQWTNVRFGINLIIEITGTGIKVRRIDQEQWFIYEEYREGQFRDAEGNNYYVLDENTIEWEDKGGDRYLRFIRSRTHATKVPLNKNFPPNDPGSENHDIDSKDNLFIERNHHMGRNLSIHESAHILTGKWTNATTKQAILVKGKRNSIQVSAQRGDSVNFQRKDHNTFIDQHGNRYDYINGQLAYTSQSGDFYMRFSNDE